MNKFIADRNEFENEATEVTSLLCKIPKFGATVHRFPYGNARKYFINNPTVIMNGLTTYIEMIPEKKGENEALVKYRMKHGENYYDELTHAADFGTFCHIACADFLTAKTLDLNLIKDEFFSYAKHTGMPLVRWKQYSYRLVNDMKAFSQFCHDKKLEPLATEYCVYDTEKLISTPLDIVCKMKFNRKTVLANINLKFRENPALYGKDIEQTNIETMIYNQKFAGTEWEATHSFIWSASNWQKEPTYKLFNTTGKYTKQDWDIDHQILELMDIRGKVSLYPNVNAKYATKSGGIIELGKPVINESTTIKQYCEKYGVS